MTEILTTTLSEVEEASPPASTFEVPAGSRYEEPVIGFPAAGR